MKNALLITFILLQYIVHSQDYDQAISKAQFLIEHHRKKTNTPGVQIAVMIDDSLIWSQGFGYSDLSKKCPVKGGTKFRIASISKSVTSVALGKMVDRGIIDLDKDIHYYLPDYPHNGSKITARLLASSTSGIRHYNEKDPRYNQEHHDSIKSALKRFKGDELLFEPGSEYHYSSYGWVLLSAVMEEAANRSFFKIMHETWNDLDMKNTTFDYPNKKVDSLSTFYIFDKKEGRIIAPDDNRSYMYAGGGYLSTSEDLVKMGQSLMDGKYLSTNTVLDLFEPITLNNGKTTSYGLGWEIGQSRLNTPIVYHSGSMSSARSHLIIYPEEKVTFAILTNTGDRIFLNDREAQSIAELFVEAKRKDHSDDTENILGNWKIKTKSLRNKRTKGRLSLNKKEDLVTGSIEFRRSRKKKSFPVILTNARNDTLHFIAVSPMFIDFFITIDDDLLNGYWLHDFNVKGIPEEDDYWAPTEINGVKLD